MRRHKVSTTGLVLGVGFVVLAGVRGGNFTAPAEELRCARRAAAAKDETTMARTFRLVYAPDQRLSYGSITFPDFTLTQ